MIELLKRPQMDMSRLVAAFPRLRRKVDAIDESLRHEVEEAVEILVKYDGYIRRERELADKMRRLENVRIPASFDFEKIQSLSTEARQKLARMCPSTIGAASRIPGVSPSDVNILLMMLGR